MSVVNGSIQLASYTAEQWSAANPILLKGQVAISSDLRKAKIGDGVTLWASLPYSTMTPEEIVAADAVVLAAAKDYADSVATGGVDASTTVKGISKLSVAPVSATDPIAVGTNDPRLSDSRTPTAHASTHTNGTDDIQNATALQKGLLTASDFTTFNNKQAAGSYATGTGTANGTNTGDDATNTQYSGLAASKQTADQDLTDISGLSPSNDDVLQRKSGAWTNRTLAQLVTDLPGVPKLITTNTSVAQPTSDFTMTVGKSYIFRIKYLVPATDGASLNCRTSEDGGSTFASSAGNYTWSVSGVNSSGTHAPSGLTTDTSIFLSGAVGNAAAESLKGRVEFNEPGSGVGYPQLDFFITHLDASTGSKFWTGQGTRQSVAAVNAIRFAMSAGNLTAVIEKWEY